MDPITRYGDELSDPIELAAGDYSLALSAYIGETIAATGEVPSFTVENIIVDLAVEIVFASLDGTGTLKYEFTDGSDVEDADGTLSKTLTWIPLSANGTAQKWIDVKTTASGEEDLNAGYYLVSATVDTWKEEASASELVHIYPNAETSIALAPTAKRAKKAWIAGLADPWTFPGAEMTPEDYLIYSWEGDVGTTRNFRIYVEDTSVWDDNEDKGRRIQPSADAGDNLTLTIGQDGAAVFKERISNGANEELSTYNLPIGGDYYKITFNAETMKVRAEAPIIFTGITINDDSAVFSAEAQTVTLTPTFQGKNAPVPTVTWEVDGTDATIDNNGVLNIPAGATVGTVYTVTATATLGEVTNSDTATVTIVAEPPKVTGIAVSATSGLDADNEASVGGQVVFTADVTGGAGVSRAVTWTVKVDAEDAASGYITTEGTTSANPTLTLTIADGDKGKTIVVSATSTVTSTISGAADGLFVKKYGDIYLVGDDWNDSWTDKTQGVKLTYDGAGVYTANEAIAKDVNFKFAIDSVYFEPWNGSTGTDIEPNGTTNAYYEPTPHGERSWKTTDYGAYAISLDTVANTATFASTPIVASVTVSAADNKTVVYRGKTLQFNAAVLGTTGNTDVTWSVTGGVADTSVSADGLLTVAAGETATSLDVTATPTLTGFEDKAGTLTVTVTDEPGGANITLSVTDAGAGLTLTKGENAFTGGSIGTISKGNAESITVTATTSDYTYEWVIDGNYADKQSGTSVTLQTAGLNLGAHTLTLIATKDGVPWSFDKPMTFTVTK
jgi:hypothetical protein